MSLGLFPSLLTWLDKLITKEDPYHIHQILGACCSLSFLCRLSYVGEDDMGFARWPQYTIPTIILHLLLHVSSFEFSIPQKRIKDGSRQWPEYRLHAAVFATGSLSAVFIAHYEREQGIVESAPNYHWNFIVVLLRLLFVDIATRSVQYPSRTIRDVKAPTILKYYFSCTQFFVTAFVLVGAPRGRCSLFFYFCMVIQVTAFQLTLQRKNLISLNVNLILYATTLSGGLFVGVYELLYRTDGNWLSVYVVMTTASFAAVWRMGPWPQMLRNKYLIWTTLYFGVVQRWLRPTLEGKTDAILTPKSVQKIATTLVTVMLINGVYKHYEK